MWFCSLSITLCNPIHHSDTNPGIRTNKTLGNSPEHHVLLYNSHPVLALHVAPANTGDTGPQHATSTKTRTLLYVEVKHCFCSFLALKHIAEDDRLIFDLNKQNKQTTHRLWRVRSHTTGGFLLINISFLECVSSYFWKTALRLHCDLIPRGFKMFQEVHYDKNSNWNVLWVQASGLNWTCLFPVEGRKQKSIALCLKQIRSDVASRVLLCFPHLKSCGIQFYCRISALQSTKRSHQTSGYRSDLSICA